jgi:hypothetical protein
VIGLGWVQWYERDWVDGWNTFLAFFSMEVCTMETRRVNGMSALLISVACAVDHQ